jgi:hypothetical protein
MPFAPTRTRPRTRTRWSWGKTREGRSVQGRLLARAEGLLALTSEFRVRSRTIQVHGMAPLLIDEENSPPWAILG